MTPATPENLRALAERFQPALRFSSGERVFPILVESWLTHASGSPWEATDEEGVAPEPSSGPHGRGTAILDGPASSPSRLGGAPNAAGTPINLSGWGPDSIAHSGYRLAQASQALFLSFAGWQDRSRRAGDPEYLRAAFSELAGAMDGANPWLEFERLANAPVLWVSQGSEPVLYAESDWAGEYVRLDPLAFAPTDHDPMSRLLVLTYHLFFPLRDSSADGLLALGPAEGQWEAVSLFFPARPGEWGGGPRRPALEYEETPTAVVLSRRGTNGPVDARPWHAVPTEPGGQHPTIFVGLADHTLLFAPPPDSAGNYSTSPPGAASQQTRLDAEDPSDAFSVPDALLIGALILGFPLGAILLLLFLLTVLLGVDQDQFQDEVDPSASVPVPSGDGAGAVAAAADAAPPGAVLPNGDRVDDPATTLLRFIDRLRSDPPPTNWPGDDQAAPPPPVEYPGWWDFAGRWGVAVNPGGGWSSGDRRVDPTGRSAGFHAAVALARAWALQAVPRP